MKLKSIVNRIVRHNPGVVRKTPHRRLTPYVLAAGLTLATIGGAKAQEAKNDTYQKQTTTLTTENSANKDKMKGEAIFGSALLLWMGAVAWGNKLHDKKR